MKRFLQRTYTIPLLGLLAALLFATVIHPRIAADFNSSLSTDGHDRLGLGIHHYDSLTFYPAHVPTVLRGPAYPVVVSTALTLGGEGNLRWSIIILQSLMHAVTVFLTMRMARELFALGPRVTTGPVILAGSLVAFHPFLIWYVARVVVEPTSIMLCTALLLLILRFSRTGYVLAGLLLGITMGLAGLTKSTYLIFIPLFPLLLLLYNRRHRFASVGRILTATILLPILLIIPWTLRNYAITETFIPVHVLDGVNFAVGDFFVDELHTSPLGFAPIVDRFNYPGLEGGLSDMMVMDPKESVAYDRELRNRSLQRYAENPLFLLEKISIQSLTFWTVGSRPLVTIVIGSMQLLLLAAVIMGAIRLWRSEGPLGRRILPLWSILFYWMAHLPLYAIGRFSVVLVPSMVVYGVWWWSEWRGLAAKS